METEKGIRLPTFVLAIIACLFWSTAFAGVKIGLQFIKPLGFAGIRFIIAGLILLPFCGNLKKILDNIYENRKIILLLSVFQTFLGYGLFYNGMTRVSGAAAAIIIGASPLISALMAHAAIADDSLTLKKSLFITLGLAGVVIISLNRHRGEAGTGNYFGIVLLLLSSISGAAGNIMIKKNKKSINPLVLNAFQLFIGGCMLFTASVLSEGTPDLSGLPIKFWAALLWLSVVSATGLSIWFRLLQRPEVKVSDLNLWKFIIPVFGAILSWMLIPGESPDLVTVIGMISVSASIIFYSLSTHKKSNAFFPET
ncbi:DMT family transporter [bacterium]|nr:DMT family transporter [bacterium]